MPQQGYKDPNRKRGTVGADDPLDAFARPLLGGEDPYSQAAREGYEDLNAQALPDIDTYGGRGRELEESLNQAAMGELQEGRERNTQAISASYSRRGLAGQGAGTAQISQSEGASLAHAAEIAARNRAFAKQRYEDLGLQERGRELSRRQFAQQLMYQNKPAENQLLPTMIGVGADIAGDFASGFGRGLGGSLGGAGGGGAAASRAGARGANKVFGKSGQGLSGQALGPGLLGPDVGRQFTGGDDFTSYGPGGQQGYPNEMEGPGLDLKGYDDYVPWGQSGAPVGPNTPVPPFGGFTNELMNDPYEGGRADYVDWIRDMQRQRR